jgi:hypothetical protein
MVAQSLRDREREVAVGAHMHDRNRHHGTVADVELQIEPVP